MLSGSGAKQAEYGRRPNRPTLGSVPLSSHLFIEKESQAQATWRAAGGLDSTLDLLGREKGDGDGGMVGEGTGAPPRLCAFEVFRLFRYPSHAPQDYRW